MFGKQPVRGRRGPVGPAPLISLYCPTRPYANLLSRRAGNCALPTVNPFLADQFCTMIRFFPLCDDPKNDDIISECACKEQYHADRR